MPTALRLNFLSGSFCTLPEESGNSDILRFLRFLDGDKVYEMIFNWSDKEVDYLEERSRAISSYLMGPNDGVDQDFSQKVKSGKLPPYGRVILELESLPGKRLILLVWNFLSLL